MLEKSGNYATGGNLLLRWNGTHWEIVDEIDAMRMALKWIEDDDYRNASAANARAAHQTALIRLPALLEPAHISVIPMRNGYLHLGSCPMLHPHDKELGLRHVLGCDYEPSTPIPEMFEKLLARVLPGIVQLLFYSIGSLSAVGTFSGNRFSPRSLSFLNMGQLILIVYHSIRTWLHEFPILNSSFEEYPWNQPQGSAKQFALGAKPPR
jgi:hypothetical protein